MSSFWYASHTLGTKEKVFSWRIDSRGNIFIKRKFRNGLFPRIDKISCSNLEKLQGFMQDREWKDLANDAAKLYTGTEKDGIGRFLYGLRPEVPYAHLSSQLAAIFYHSEVWEWNEQKRGMKFLLLPGNWQERTMRYYRSSLDPVNEGTLINQFLESDVKVEQGQGKEELQEALQEEAVPKIEQTKLLAFFNV